MYSIDLISSNAAEGVEVLSDSVLNPKFNTWEVDEAIAKLKVDLEKYKNNAQNIMTEVSSFLMDPKKSRPQYPGSSKLTFVGFQMPWPMQSLHSVNRCITLSRPNRHHS